MILFLDLETNGLPKGRGNSTRVYRMWPEVLQLAFLSSQSPEENTIYECLFRRSEIEEKDWSEYPHGISYAQSQEEGQDPEAIYKTVLIPAIEAAEQIIIHNRDFDWNVLQADFYRLGLGALPKKRPFCTMKSPQVQKFVGIRNQYGGYKWPKLNELYKACFGHEFENQHNASADVIALAESYFHLKNIGVL